MAIKAVQQIMLGTVTGSEERTKDTLRKIKEAGYDGIDMGKYYTPSISTVKQPVDTIAKESILLLIDIISGKRTHQHKVFDAEILIRESTSL